MWSSWLFGQHRCAEERPLCTLKGFSPEQEAMSGQSQAWSQLLALSREGEGSCVLQVRPGLAKDPLTRCPSFRA